MQLPTFSPLRIQRLRTLALTLFTSTALAHETPPDSGPMVTGNRAVLRGDFAAAPANAPTAVKRAIWATNFIIRKPYIWGGGHETFYDRGYDCSGTVSFLLRHAGAIESPAPSRGLMEFGEPGPGRWITVYARPGHAFAVVAGLRLDTTGQYADEGPGWRGDGRPPWGFVARHPRGM